MVSEFTSDNIIDLEKAKDDPVLTEYKNKLRTFLSSSMQYDNHTIEEFIKPVEEYLKKENAIIKMKKGNFKDCFDICYFDFSFSLSLAKKGAEWHKNNNRKIYYNLFKTLMN